jgi:hypothetical protein
MSKSCSLAKDDSSSGDEPSFVTLLSLQDFEGTETTLFDRGEEITLDLTVRNRLDSASQVDLPDGRTADFVVVRENTNDVVWQWSKNQAAFPTTAHTLEFAAAESKPYSVTWNQQTDNGNAVSAGTYEARGVLVYSGFDSNPLTSNQLGSTLVRFTIN